MDYGNPPQVLRDIVTLIHETLAEWRRDRSPRMAAALAFYTLFSLAPLLVIVTAVAGFVVRSESVQDQIFVQIESYMGKEFAEAAKGMIQTESRPSSGVVATVAGVFLLVFGSSRMFLQLQSALDTIWNVQHPPGKGLRKALLARLISFGMVFGTGFFLLATLFLASALATVIGTVRAWLPGTQAPWIALNFAVNFLITSVVFAAIFKLLPATKIRWSDVWIGAILTTVMFSIGRFLLSLYLGWGFLSSVYGAASALIVILVWVYYSAQIVLLGAEFTHIFALRHGSKRRVPDAGAPGDPRSGPGS